MRIAILGSVALPVPPPAQGGTEWIAYYQAKGLSDLGHNVILFAAKGSTKENYQLVEVGGGDTVVGSNTLVNSLSRSLSHSGKPRSNGANPESAGEDPGQARMTINFESSRSLRKENVYLAEVIEKLIERKNDYDIILNNMRGEAVFLPFARHCLAQGKPFVNVMHLPIFGELAGIFKKYNTPLISISNAQRTEFPDLNYLATIYNCVDTDKFSFNENSGDYMLMMGSISPHKNQAGAIAVAKETGMRLVLAGKIGDKEYFDTIKKDIDGKQITWYGELGFGEKVKLYREAKVFIFPVMWEEPFGLVMIEAMSCGTPVVALANGAIPEVVVAGKTGFVIDNLASSVERLASSERKYIIKKEGEAGLIEAVKRINSMSETDYKLLRQNCRKHVEENFTVEKMVKGYAEALQRLASSD